MMDLKQLPATPPALPRVPFYIVVQKSTKKSIEESYNSAASKLVGKIHLFCGAVSFFTGVCLIINFMDHSPHFVSRFGAGIWCSAIFFLAGFLGMFSANNRSSRMIITTMVVGIFSTMFALALIIFSAIGLSEAPWFHYAESSVSIGMNSLQLIIGITEFVLAIISSSLSCKATCCRDKMDTTSQSSKVMFSPTGGLDHDQIVCLARQMQQSGEKGEPSTSHLPPSYEDIARVEEGMGEY